MIRAIKSVSTERGRDPREFALFAFGGNGPLFACGMAKSLGMSRVVVPPSAGLFSSFGLLYADVEHHYSRTFRRLLRQADLAEIERAWTALADQATAQLAAEDFAGRSHAAAPLGGAALSGPELRAHRAGAGRARSMRAWSSISRRRSARSTRRPTAIAPARTSRSSWSRSRSSGRACARAPAIPERLKPSRAEPQPPPPRRAYFGERRLARDADPAPLRSHRRAPRPVDHRGIRRDLRRAARRHGEPRCRRQHRHRAAVTLPPPPPSDGRAIASGLFLPAPCAGRKKTICDSPSSGRGRGSVSEQVVH